MALPKLNAAVYSTTIPSTNKSVKFRPFTVKEQKALLLADQENSELVAFDTIKEVIKNCLIDFKGNIDELCTFDIEWLMIKIRGKSVGEIVELQQPCTACGKDIRFNVNIDEIETPKVSKDLQIKVRDDVVFGMHYPRTNDFEKLVRLQMSRDVDMGTDMLAMCIDTIFIGEETYRAKDQSHEELTGFIDDLQASEYLKLQEFLSTLPSVKYEAKVTCKCGNEQQVKIEGLSDFFL